MEQRWKHGFDSRTVAGWQVVDAAEQGIVFFSFLVYRLADRDDITTHAVLYYYHQQRYDVPPNS